jgi:hypothetical protein
MFHIVPPHQHKLTLTVEIERVHHAESRLPRAPACRAHATSQKCTHHQQQNEQKDNKEHRAQNKGRGRAEFVEQGLHRAFHFAGDQSRPFAQTTITSAKGPADKVNQWLMTFCATLQTETRSPILRANRNASANSQFCGHE